jgi:hypothetical protein
MYECDFVKKMRADMEGLKSYSPQWWRLSATINDHKAECKECNG